MGCGKEKRGTFVGSSITVPILLLVFKQAAAENAKQRLDRALGEEPARSMNGKAGKLQPDAAKKVSDSSEQEAQKQSEIPVTKGRVLSADEQTETNPENSKQEGQINANSEKPNQEAVQKEAAEKRAKVEADAQAQQKKDQARIEAERKAEAEKAEAEKAQEQARFDAQRRADEEKRAQEQIRAEALRQAEEQAKKEAGAAAAAQRKAEAERQSAAQKQAQQEQEAKLRKGQPKRSLKAEAADNTTLQNEPVTFFLFATYFYVLNRLMESCSDFGHCSSASESCSRADSGNKGSACGTAAPRTDC